jgi:hypothetical protein
MTVASINTFFDGVDVCDLSVWGWTNLHLHLFLGNPSVLKKYHLMRDKYHPLAQIIDEFSPDVIVANEVTRSPWGSRSFNILKDHSGYHVTKAKDPTNPSKFHRMTILATKFPTKDLELDVTRFPGGRFCAAEDEKGRIFIGVQGSPFLHASRMTQIKSVFEKCEEYLRNDCEIVVAGDFNTNLEGEKVQLPDRTVHVTHPSFPHPDFYRLLEETKNPLVSQLKRFLKLNRGPRPLDHIIASDKYKLERSQSVKTGSDHLALVAELTYNGT